MSEGLAAKASFLAAREQPALSCRLLAFRLKFSLLIAKMACVAVGFAVIRCDTRFEPSASAENRFFPLSATIPSRIAFKLSTRTFYVLFHIITHKFLRQHTPNKRQRTITKFGDQVTSSPNLAFGGRPKMKAQNDFGPSSPVLYCQREDVHVHFEAL
jgi:hypothetical protein